MRLFPADRVRLTDGPFARALQTDRRYLLHLDPDRLLAPYLREAGLPPRAPSYGNWESSGLDGHTLGHYLSALSHLVAATGDTEAGARVRYVVDELDRAQDAVGTGWVGGVPGGAALFEALRDAAPDAALDAVRALGSSDHWVPWYNLHKVFQGLTDASAVAGERRALDVVVRLADWWLDIASTVGAEAFEEMLDTEFGGMNDAYAQLALLTGRGDYARMARRFSHRAILDPLLEGRDDLTGRHANTQIPKAVGYASTGTATGDPALLTAADTFWRAVTERRTVAIGGNSVREHFHDAGDFTPMIDDREGPEFCNTVNMLRLTRRLAEARLRPEHLDYVERALFNQVLASQHPDHGGFVYFTSLRPGHYRVYSAADDGFWCCVGTGMEAHVRHGEWVFGLEGGALAVNLPIGAELDLDGFGRVRLETSFPDVDRVALTLDLDRPARFAVRLRVPGWLDGLVDLTLDGVALEDTDVTRSAVPGAVLLEREWQPGDVIRYRMPLALRAERLPDGSAWQAYLAGPLVLAGRGDTRRLDGLVADDSRMGHVAHGPLRPFADLPVVAPGSDAVTESGPLRYRLTPRSGAPVELEPFFRLHDARYTVYWPVADGDVPTRRAELAVLDRGLALDARTLDAVAFGEQQPESDHAFRGEGAPGVQGDRHWRSPTERMSVQLANPDGAGRSLRVGFRTTDEPTRVSIRLAGRMVAVESFEPGEEFLELDYDVAGILAAAGTDGTGGTDGTDGEAGTVELQLATVDGGATPGITTVRLLRWGT